MSAAELSEWGEITVQKNGYVRWNSILHSFSIDCVKAGYLVKNKGIWYLIPEGEAALAKAPDKLLDCATSAYREWKACQADKKQDIPDAEPPEATMTLAEVEQAAMSGLESYIRISGLQH